VTEVVQSLVQEPHLLVAVSEVEQSPPQAWKPAAQVMTQVPALHEVFATLVVTVPQVLGQPKSALVKVYVQMVPVTLDETQELSSP